jgi:beta-fructofuranosidase
MSTSRTPIHIPHPERFTWDFWYHYDEVKRLFHLLFLNADRALAPQNLHHFSSRVGYAVTEDFTSIDWIDDDVFSAHDAGWDNTSIWTGDVVTAVGGYVIFYTSRDGRVGDTLTQNVGAAFSTDFRSWERVGGFRLEPDERFYEPKSIIGDPSIHAWRDPFLFVRDGDAYMVIAAKDIAHPLGRKGAVGLLKCRGKNLTQWEAMAPLYSPGGYCQVEVPQILLDDAGRTSVVYSMPPESDHVPETSGVGGFHRVEVSLSDTDQNHARPVEVLLPHENNPYACRVIPELDGLIVGFHLTEGGFVNTGVRTGLSGPDRNFEGFTVG